VLGILQFFFYNLLEFSYRFHEKEEHFVLMDATRVISELHTNLIISISRYNEESQRCRRCIIMMKQPERMTNQKIHFCAVLFNLTLLLCLLCYVHDCSQVDWKLIPRGCFSVFISEENERHNSPVNT
jgi:hypothetical protein